MTAEADAVGVNLAPRKRKIIRFPINMGFVLVLNLRGNDSEPLTLRLATAG